MGVGPRGRDSAGHSPTTRIKEQGPKADRWNGGENVTIPAGLSTSMKKPLRPEGHSGDRFKVLQPYQR